MLVAVFRDPKAFARLGTFIGWGGADLEKSCQVAKPTIRQIVLETGIPVEKFTCYDCPLSNNCRSAFDPYNTDGDCLEMK